MTYTGSSDGKLRQNFGISIRLTKDELDEYNERAKENGYKDLRDWITCHLYVLDIASILPFDEEINDL